MISMRMGVKSYQLEDICFFYKQTEASEKTDTENDQVSKQQTDNSTERVITVRRKKRKVLPEINTSVFCSGRSASTLL